MFMRGARDADWQQPSSRSTDYELVKPFLTTRAETVLRLPDSIICERFELARAGDLDHDESK